VGDRIVDNSPGLLDSLPDERTALDLDAVAGRLVPGFASSGCSTAFCEPDVELDQRRNAM
jgi:hypothetical protein